MHVRGKVDAFPWQEAGTVSNLQPAPPNPFLTKINPLLGKLLYGFELYGGVYVWSGGETIVKGMVSRDEYFPKVQKSKQYFSMSADWFLSFRLSFCLENPK